MIDERGDERQLHKIPVPIQDFYDIREICSLVNIGVNRVYEYAKRKDDPLPLRCFPGTKRGAFVFRNEFEEWVKRNSILIVTRHRKI
ncbi:MAG: helix-turn-helix domain-containing protein [Clostridiales bacterium]|nr:helix-turn-helix domain-containing protein [Clostridiales bacterium]